MVFYTGQVCQTAGHRPGRSLPAVRDVPKSFFEKRRKALRFHADFSEKENGFSEKENGSILTIQKNYGIIVR